MSINKKQLNPLILNESGENIENSIYYKNNRFYGNCTKINYNFRNCIQLDGINDYLTTPNHSDLEFGTDDFSLSSWIWIDPSYTNAYGRLLMKSHEVSVGFSRKGIDLRVSNTGVVIFLVMDGVGDYSVQGINSSPISIPKSTWAHIVALRRSGDLFLYIDGVLVNRTNTGAFGYDVSSPSYLAISGHTPNPAAVYFMGRIDETQIYKGYSLTVDEILYLYNSGNGNHPPQNILQHLSARWTFDTLNTNTYPNPTILDMSGNGNTLTGYNIATNPLISH